MDRETVMRLAREAGWPEMTIPKTPALQQSLIDLVALAAAHEREEIMNEWWSRVQADLEHGVKSLNEQAAKDWREKYPEIAGFAAAIRARGDDQ